MLAERCDIETDSISAVVDFVSLILFALFDKRRKFNGELSS